PIKLRLGVGSSGYSGLWKGLAEDLVRSTASDRKLGRFAVGWYEVDARPFNLLAENVIDISVTCHLLSQKTALAQGVASRRECCFRDHWVLGGPKRNPAGLVTDGSQSIFELLSTLFIAGICTSGASPSIHFLTKFDASAANVKESNLWSTIGQAPWSDIHSSWYHRYVNTSPKALEVAAQMQEYTLIEGGTWLAADAETRENMMVFKRGGDDEKDPLLCPVHALVGTNATNKELAEEFLEWVIEAEGQKLIQAFAINGIPLYTEAPVSLRRLSWFYHHSDMDLV
ncbi:uncharacterized protein LY89DRAFT_600716, partial [Mollisia scopiformis]